MTSDCNRVPSPFPGQVRKQPQGRQAKSKSRVDAFQQLSSRVAVGTAALKDGGSVSLGGASMQRLGGKLLACHRIAVDAPGGDGRRVVNGFEYVFGRIRIESG